VSTTIAAAAALAATFCFAVGSLAQHGVAVRETGKGILSFGLLLSLLRQRRWVGGIVRAAASFAIQGLALAFGPLTLVQPLAATDELFALPLIARRNRRRLTVRDAAGAFLVTAGIVIFLSASAPRSGCGVPSLAAVGAVSVGSAVAAWPVRGSARGAVDILAVSGAHVLATCGPYAMFVVAVFGALFGQSAYGSGALSLSLPVIDTVEPVAAVTIGATVSGERLASSAYLLSLQLTGGGLAVAGIAVLSRSSVVRDETELSSRSFRAQ
jgi:hypothetical protein